MSTLSEQDVAKIQAMRESGIPQRKIVESGLGCSATVTKVVQGKHPVKPDRSLVEVHKKEIRSLLAENSVKALRQLSENLDGSIPVETTTDLRNLGIVSGVMADKLLALEGLDGNVHQVNAIQLFLQTDNPQDIEIKAVEARNLALESIRRNEVGGVGGRKINNLEGIEE